jgi:hypothetical protein
MMDLEGSCGSCKGYDRGRLHMMRDKSEACRRHTVKQTVTVKCNGI